jgi:AcrR family transcriptional regulator
MASDTSAPSTEAGTAPDAKQRIYDTAVRLFARNGFAATGVRELAREADVNLATVNYFFGSKKGLLKEILADFFGQFIGLIERELPGDAPPLDRLRRTIPLIGRLFAAEREKMLIVITELPHDDPDVLDTKADFVRRIVAVVQREIAEPIERETGVRVPLGIVGPAMTSLLASAFLFRPVIDKLPVEGLQQLSLEKYPDLMAELYVNGLAGVLEAQKGRTS